MIPRYQLLALRIRDAVEDLQRTADRVTRAWQAAQSRQSEQDLLIDSAALNLHSFYSGVEQLCEAIALELDGGLPKGEAWHRDLLRQMTFDLAAVRPPVLSSETAQSLDEYRRFRHVVRNVYAEYLDPERIQKLVDTLSNLWPQLKTELTSFAEFLEGVSRADDAAQA